MIAIKPPPGFENSLLDIETIPAGRRFGRIYASAFPDPLGYGKTPSRFSDPRRRDPGGRFGVVYLGDTHLARAWSLAFHEHRSVPDGIICPSRLNGHTNLAIFDPRHLKIVGGTRGAVDWNTKTEAGVL